MLRIHSQSEVPKEGGPIDFPEYELINEINNKIILSDFIGRKVNISRRGREFIGLCPFHEEKTPSFTINDDKNF